MALATEVFWMPSESMWTMRQLARKAILATPLDAWRHHGIGVLQAYVTEGDHELRIHVWHPSLVVVPPDRGDIHDHRFFLRSFVLCGAIMNGEYDEVATGGDALPDTYHFDEYEVTPYRDATKAGCGYAPRKVRSRVRYLHDGIQIPAGAFYTFPAGIMHHTQAAGLTITLVEKTNVIQGVNARILSRAGLPPVDAFDKDRPRPPVAELIQEALEALS